MRVSVCVCACTHTWESELLLFSPLVIAAVVMFSEVPVVSQWHDIPGAESVWDTVTTPSSAAMDTDTSHAHVQREREEEAKKVAIEKERQKQREAMERKKEEDDEGAK